jgi:hypothetical protein
VKHSDVAGQVFLEEYENITMLVFEHEDSYGRLRRTLIYYIDGWLYEMNIRVGVFPGLAAGQPIIRTLPLYFTDSGNGLIRATVDGRSLYVYPRR